MKFWLIIYYIETLHGSQVGQVKSDVHSHGSHVEIGQVKSVGLLDVEQSHDSQVGQVSSEVVPSHGTQVGQVKSGVKIENVVHSQGSQLVSVGHVGGDIVGDPGCAGSVISRNAFAKPSLSPSFAWNWICYIKKINCVIKKLRIE